MKHFLLIATVFSFSFIFNSCTKLERPVPNAGKTGSNRIAYIYKTDSSDAVAFKQLLETNGCTVTLLEKSSVSTTNFSGYSLVVVGHNTDGLTIEPKWTSSESDAIKQSGKPLLLIGLGGMQLAKKMGNNISFNNCGFSGLTGMNVIDAGSNLYKSPYPISVVPGTQLQLYTEYVSAMSYFNDGSASNVVLIGGETLDQHYPLASEDRYSFFGFIGAIDKMTSTGKNLLVNYVYQAGQLTVPQ